MTDTTVPVRVATISARYTVRPQLWRDPWRNADRVCRYTGACVICGMRTYAFDDGENDPRGVLGDRASHALSADEFDTVGPDVPLCALCASDGGDGAPGDRRYRQGRYFRAVDIAHKRWGKVVARIARDADTLNSRVEFDSPFRITDDYRLTDAPADIHAPSSYDGELDGSAWEYWSHGYTGQYGYRGPIMHSSEILAGRMARDLLSAPGIYAVVADEDSDDDSDEPNGWAVVRHVGNVPEGGVIRFRPGAVTLDMETGEFSREE